LIEIDWALYTTQASAPMEKNDRIIINGIMRTKVRFKQTWLGAIKKDMLMFHVIEDMTLNGAK